MAIIQDQKNRFPFQYVTIPETLPESELERLGPVEFLIKLNKTSEASFKDCISQLLLQQGNDIACIIYDEFMYFSEAAAKEFQIPSLIFGTTSATSQCSRNVLSKLNAEKFLIDIEDPEVQDKMVENLHPLRYKDLPTSGFGPLKPFLNFCRKVSNKRRASGVIMNTVSCLEGSSLSWLQQELRIPMFPLGPLHMTASMPLEQDMSCSEWLDEEGAGMRERALALKEKIKASARNGGSSYKALDELVKHLKTE